MKGVPRVPLVCAEYPDSACRRVQLPCVQGPAASAIAYAEFQNAFLSVYPRTMVYIEKDRNVA